MPNHALNLDSLIRKAIDDHVNGREDSRGFSSLDNLIGYLQAEGRSNFSSIENALLGIIDKSPSDDPKVWEAVRMIIDAAGLKSDSVAAAIINILDKKDFITYPAARFQAFLAYKSTGGALTRPRLDHEHALRYDLTPQWVDLVLSTYCGAPENIISFIEEQLHDPKAKLGSDDIRRRLPLFFRLLGPAFNRGIVRIINAIPNEKDRKEIAAAVERAFKLDPVAELKNTDQPDVPTTRRSKRNFNEFDDVIHDTFKEIKEELAAA